MTEKKSRRGALFLTFQKRVGRFKGTPLGQHFAVLFAAFLNRRARDGDPGRRWRHAHISTAELRLHVMAMRFVSTVLHLARHTAFSNNRRCLLPSFGALARGGARRLDVRAASSAPPPPIITPITSASGTSTGTATACSTAATTATAAIARDTNRLLVIGRTQRDAAQLEARLSPLVPRRSASQPLAASASEAEPTHAFSLEFASRDTFLGSVATAAASSSDPHSSAPPPPPPRQLQFDIPLFLSALRTHTLGSVLMYSDRVTSTQSILSECVYVTTCSSSYIKPQGVEATNMNSMIQSNPKTNLHAARLLLLFNSNIFMSKISRLIHQTGTLVPSKNRLCLRLPLKCLARVRFH
jgi:hypothetical protein